MLALKDALRYNEKILRKRGKSMVRLRNRIGLLFVITAMLCFLPLPAQAAQPEDNSEYTWITDREAVDGGDYTDDPDLAAALNDIFDGNANIYYDSECTQMVDTTLGTYRVPNNGVFKYVGPYGDDQLDMGTSCWIYANGVFFTLFEEGTGLGTAGENSEKLDLTTTENRNITYDNFTAWGVRPGVGALIRTKEGHSMIVLGYDQERLTILDGNGDGKGLVSIRVRTWDRVFSRASYIIQPTEEFMEDRYPQDDRHPQVLTVRASEENEGL